MRRAAALALVGALCLASAGLTLAASNVMSLDALTWGVTNANGTIALKTKLPAYPINLLQEKGIVQDPLYRFGELETRWVAMDTWTFATEFTVSEEVAKRSSVDLVLDGVDTFATVYLNDKQIASLENFHRKYLLPVKSQLKPGVNTLKIVLAPAIKVAIDRKANHPYWIPTVTQLGNIDAYNFARKPAYDFGWDWGPGLGAAGIYGAVSLVGYDTALLRSAHVRQVKAPSSFLIRVQPELIVPASGDAGLLTIEMPALGLKAEKKLDLTSSGRALPELELAVPADSVDLWWPLGYGEQKLYDLTVTWTSSGASAAASGGVPAATIKRRVGFRTVELVEKPLPEAAAELFSAAGAGWEGSAQPGNGVRACMGMNNCGQYGWVDGKKWTFISTEMTPNFDFPVSGYDFAGAFPNSSFPGGDNPWWNHRYGVWTGWGAPSLAKRVEGESMYFKVNGVPIYAKGANIIPLHTLPVNATDELLAETLDYATDARMNMLRVWGGGWYMPDSFYDACDEKGILVWQETMFACASYPRDTKFMAEVADEVEQQIRRISWHPSVVIWGGNNEIEASLEWYRETQNNPALFVHDYTELFISTIGGLMQELVPELPYVDSSPSNGVVSRQPFIKRWGAAWDQRYGDVHHYNYDADCQDFNNFPMAKFVSEHGWPSFPTWPTFKAATSEDDWAVFSPGMEFRQRHFNKTLEMTEQYRKHFKLPKSWTGKDKAESFAKWKRYLYLNHVQQALCIDTAFSYWRRLRSEPQGLTMGILYWQLNDVWAGASWSGIDYEGRYKPMQHRVKHQFADFVLQTVLDNGHAQVFLVSDDTAPTTAAIDLTVHRLAEPACGCARDAPAADAAACAAAGTEPVWSKRVTDVTVPALNSALVVNASVSELLAAMPKCTPTTCFLRATATTKATKNKPASTSSAELFFKDFKELKLERPNLQLSNFTQVTPESVSFVVSTDRAAALLVVIDSDLKGRLDNNMINLAPCSSATLTFTAPRGGAVGHKALKASLAVTSLFENSHDDAVAAEDGAAAPVVPAAVAEPVAAAAAKEDEKSPKAKKEEKKEEKKEGGAAKEEGAKAPAAEAPVAEEKKEEKKEEAAPAKEPAAQQL
ncbi:beta-mannosidase [Raphidocelis subcapitata]|uniref:beta-mannosidase n=1 Tax=Raphidocelis subcapitata TaxID=307507 RepID=A0A2V0NT31_9CHLO|nr:beta-mannosidase [Raphidocelis subcapitata]|eukprot:GBF90838.1 beta-mannosidase [Raphidocelis subcapitata]